MTIFPFLAKPMVEQIFQLSLDETTVGVLAAHNTKLFLYGVEVAAGARQAVYQSEDSEPATNDKASPLSILAQLGNQGLPIDESHASLGMVYTNPPDDAADEAVEEAPELRDGAYRVISESATEEVLKPPEAESEVDDD